jgi:hypothetical protein
MSVYSSESVGGAGHDRAAASIVRRSEDAELLGAGADQHVLGVLIVIEHHLVVFAPDPDCL